MTLQALDVNVRVVTEYVREFGSAALFAMLVVCTIFFVWYVATAWATQASRKGWRSFYTWENKAAIALLTTFVGAAVKNGAALVVLHWQVRGQHPQSLALAFFYTAGMLVSLWGMICLMRALSRYEWPRGTWLALVAIAMVFGAAFLLAS